MFIDTCKVITKLKVEYRMNLSVTQDQIIMPAVGNCKQTHKVNS